MTLTMSTHIIFPESRGRKELHLYRCTEVTIERSWKEFTGRADIVLPRRVKVFGDISYSDLFHAGDPVEIRLGYGTDEPVTEFIGYLSDISEGVPVHLRCEDEMYRLKRGTVSIVSSAITLRALLEKAAAGYQIECPDVQFGAVRFANVAPVDILKSIKEKAGLYSYFEGKKLFCGVIYGDQSDMPTVNVNVEKNAVSENLNRKNNTEEVEIKAISILRNGRKIEAVVGKKGGVSVQRTYVGITVKAELERKAKADLQKYKTQGFDGSVTLFGVPRLQHGDKVRVVSEFYKNMEGFFYVEKTVKKFNSEGYRQEITLGDKVG